MCSKTISLLLRVPLRHCCFLLQNVTRLIKHCPAKAAEWLQELKHRSWRLLPPFCSKDKLLTTQGGSQVGSLGEGCCCPRLRHILKLPLDPASLSPLHPMVGKHTGSIMSFSWMWYRESPGSFKKSPCDSLLLILWPPKVRVDIWFNAMPLYCLYYIYIAEAHLWDNCYAH